MKFIQHSEASLPITSIKKKRKKWHSVSFLA